MRVECNSKGKIDVFAEDEDKCKSCELSKECPLVCALHEEAVILRYDSVEIVQCGLYKAEKKKWSLV